MLGVHNQSSWVSSYLYLGGHFVICGGTYPFWNERLNSLRGPMSLPPKTLHGITVQGTAFHLDQKENGILGIVQLEITVEHDGQVSKIKVLSGEQAFVEDAKTYIKSTEFPAFPDIPQFANARGTWKFEVAFFAKLGAK